MFLRRQRLSEIKNERLEKLNKTISVLRTKKKDRNFKSRLQEFRDYLKKKSDIRKENEKTTDVKEKFETKLPEDIPIDGLRLTYFPSTDASIPLFISINAAAILAVMNKRNKGSTIHLPKGNKHGAPIYIVSSSNEGIDQRTEIGRVYRQSPPNYDGVNLFAPFGYFLDVNDQRGLDIYIHYPETTSRSTVRDVQNQGERIRKYRWFKEARKNS